jgi:hypothetical protein
LSEFIKHSKDNLKREVYNHEHLHQVIRGISNKESDDISQLLEKQVKPISKAIGKKL